MLNLEPLSQKGRLQVQKKVSELAFIDCPACKNVQSFIGGSKFSHFGKRKDSIFFFDILSNRLLILVT